MLICQKEADAAHALKLATQAREPFPWYQHEEIGYNYRLSNICAGIGRGQMLVLPDNISARRSMHHHYCHTLSHLPGLTFLKNSPHNNSPKAITNSLVESELDKREFEPKFESDFESNMWLTCIVVNPAEAGFTREDLRLAMDAANIETRPLWKPMHLQPLFVPYPFYTTNENSPSGANFPSDLKLGSMENRQAAINSNIDNSISGILFEHGLCLPSHPGLTESDLERIVGVIKKLAKQ
jgi:dTDP-4-amino-4,6-dideoxygalactose transaminase